MLDKTHAGKAAEGEHVNGAGSWTLNSWQDTEYGPPNTACVCIPFLYSAILFPAILLHCAALLYWALLCSTRAIALHALLRGCYVLPHSTTLWYIPL